MSDTIHIGFLLYPGATQLDITGPAQVFCQLPGAVIHMVWKNRDPVDTDAGFSINPTDTFETCPTLDVLCVGGGGGQLQWMSDESVLQFLREQASNARYVTSVCGGSLLLGAAGAIEGYQSACHWAYLDMLPKFGATPIAQRVVRDRNRFSGGGVTAGIDFALTLAAEIAGEEEAKAIQLLIEYNPAPPFDCGSPAAAGPQIEAIVRGRLGQPTPAEVATKA